MELMELKSDPQWNYFLLQSRNPHIYQTKEMAKVMETLNFNARFFVLLDGKKRKAQIAFLEKIPRGHLIKKLASSWLSYSPPALLCKKSKEREIFNLLITALQNKAKEDGISWITIWSSPQWDPVDWFSELDFESSEKENAVLELKKTSEETCVPTGKIGGKEEGIKRFKKKWGKIKKYHEFRWYSGKIKKIMIKGIKSIKGD